MGLDLRLTQKLTQKLVMTPQLRQALKILQLPRGELDMLVDEALAENPVLERVTEDEAIFDDSRGQGEEPTATHDVRPEKDQIDWQTYLSIYNNSHERSAPAPTGDEDADGQRYTAPEDRLSRTESLADHLTWQLRFRSLTATQEQLASLIIGNLDVDGYLEAGIEELAESADASPEEVERVLRIVQACDPIGVGARTLQECLLLQLQAAQPESGALDEALLRLTTTIVRHYLHSLEGRRYDRLAKQLHASTEEIQRAVKLITALEPKPGRNYGGGEIRYITPDVDVHKIGDEYRVTLNEEGLPRLKVSQAYRYLLAQDGAAKAYVQEKLRAAAWLIKSIHQRQRTVLMVAESLVKFQQDFLNYGVAHMRPLVLRDVADEIGAHESTVSRAIAGKYIATPRGLYPFKKFFTTGLKSRSGQDVAAESVKAQIRAFIEREDPSKPLSDEAIAKMLSRSHIKIARRTVAKYREGLHILSSAKRKCVR